MHNIQINIIKNLREGENYTFSKLNVEKVSSDLFNFHLKKLIKENLISKDNKGYSLTDEGKLISLELDFENLQTKKSPRISIDLICRSNNKFLIQKRLVHPYKNYFEFPSRKIEFGATPEATVEKLASEELGIRISNVQFHGVNHKIDLKVNKDKVLSDRYFLVYSCDFTTGNLNEFFEDGQNLWLTMDEFKSNGLKHFDIKNILKIYKSKSTLTNISNFPMNF